jgi:LuxR family transcriptional regulator, maltose regulon positive regulatory protein
MPYSGTPTPDHVARTRLSGLLDAVGLGLVVGPAGSGKSTLVRDWLDGTGRRHAWVSIDAGDPSAFWGAVGRGLSVIDRSIGLEALDRLDLGDEPDLALVASLAADVAGSGQTPLVLVLDDLHRLDDESHRQLLWLLEHQPPQLAVVAITREDPPWPLARWRVRDQLVEIRAADLRFTLDEAAVLLADAALEPDQLAALLARAEGWAAGLKLARLALRRTTDRSAYLARFGGTEKTVAEFLFSEVLDDQPDDVRDFLLVTCVLERLEGALCDALTGRADSATMLASLEASGLFVEQTDPVGRWYRYHQLFAELLRAWAGELGVDLAAAHRDAAAWFRRAGMVDEALHHAHRSGDPSLLLRYLRGLAPALYAQGRSAECLRWLDRLPRGHLEQSIVNGLGAVYILTVTGHYAEALRWLDRIEASAAPEDPMLAHLQPSRALLSASRGAADDHARAMARIRAESSVPLGPEAVAALNLWTQRMAWLAEAGSDPYAGFRTTISGLDDGRAIGAEVAETFVRSARAALALALAVDGSVSDAAREARQAIAEWDAGGQPSCRNAADAFLAEAVVAIESGHLAEAQRRLDDADSTEADNESLFHAAVTGLVRAELARAGGHPHEALDVLAATRQRSFGLEPGEALLARLAEAEVAAAFEVGRPDTALAALADVTVEPARSLATARVRLAEGHHDRALAELDGLGPLGRRRAIEAELLRARVLLGDRPDEARVAVARAVERCGTEPLGWTFAREPMLAPLYAEEPVAARLPPYQQRSAPEAAGVVELSRRELDVLGLLASDRSNQELAAELFVSVNTLRVHLRNVYRKLGASSRTDALIRAEALGLVSAP